MIKCSKCGTECTDKASFCPNCGKSLAEEREAVLSETRTYKCSKCGAVFKGKKAFCENCGTKLSFEGETLPPAAPKEEPKEETAQKVEKPAGFGKATKIVNIILYSISFLAILFSLISVWLDFGAYSSVLSYGMPSELGISFFFDTMLEEESLIVCFVVAFATFLVTTVMTYIFGIIALVKQIKTGAKKEFKVVSKPLCLTVLLPLMSQILSYAVLYSNIEEFGIVIKEEVGAGLTLSLISVAILFTIIVVYHVFNNINSKKDIVPAIFKCVIALFFLIAARYAFEGAISLDTGFSSMSAKANVSFLANNSWSTLVNSEEDLSKILANMIIQNVCIIMIFIATIEVFDSVNKKNGSAGRIVNPSIAISFMFSYILIHLVTIDSIEYISPYEPSLSGNFVVSLILMIAALGLAIATAILDKKNQVKAN